MESLSTILDIIKDHKWHDRAEISEKVPLKEEELDMAFKFLEDMGAIQMNEKRGRIKITKLGSEILELPENGG